MKKDYLLFQMHVMWYEYMIVKEGLDSLQRTMENSDIDVKINLCLNHQTYLEEPVEGTAREMFDEFMDHDIMKIANITYKGPEDDFYNNDFQNDMSLDSFADDQNFDIPPDELLPEDDFQQDGNNARLEIYQFNADDRVINKEFESLKEDISSIFESNYFQINIRSDYLSSLNFLKYLQEYKIAILPYCFEPQMTGNNFNSSEAEASIGEVDARIIVNIPNYK